MLNLKTELIFIPINMEIINQITLTEISMRPDRDFISTNCITSSFLNPHSSIAEPE